MKNPHIQDNSAPSVCGTCHNSCCARMPGICHPGEFGETEEEVEKSLYKALRSGKYEVDYWEGSPFEYVDKNHEDLCTPERLAIFDAYDDEWGYTATAYFVRPYTIEELRHITQVIAPRYKHGSWGGRCIFLGETGCKLSFDERPIQCRVIVPNAAHPGECIIKSPHYSKQALVILWLDYNHIISRVLERLWNEEKDLSKAQ